MRGQCPRPLDEGDVGRSDYSKAHGFSRGAEALQPPILPRFLCAGGGETAYCLTGARSDRTILRDFRLVSIALGEQDDAQIIFETLNGHGAQLHATDLIRNFIFMRADREDNTPATELFESLWSPLEAEFWSQAQRRGRLLRPRLEWFIQTTLQAVSADEVEIGRLYASYRAFANKGGKPISAELQLRLLDRHAEKYRQLVTGIGDDS